MIEQLHFIRPWWLLALIPLAGFLLLSLRKVRNSRGWQQVCDAQLLPHVLTDAGTTRSHLFNWLMFTAALLAIIAAAGPAWEKLPQPVFRDQSALVIAMDLSQSMNATDLKPSRLERARLKLLDILAARNSGQTALVVYADDAFTVTPLTDDSHTIANLAPTLTADLMPAQGSNVVAAIEKSVQLMQQAGSNQGHILLLTDSIRQQDIDTITTLLDGRYRLSILGIGTTDGSPIPKAGGFLQDSNGAIVIAKMNEDMLRRAAAAGSGSYQRITNDDSDIRRLLATIDSSGMNLQHNDNELHADVWREQGPWLLLLAAPLVALAARKGWLLTWSISLGMLMVSAPRDGFALEPGGLWRTPDQQAMAAFEQGDTKTAAETFRDPLWKASALYKQGDYQQAADLLQQVQSAGQPAGLAAADLLYNHANALAKAGQLQQALQQYEAALELDPHNEDAAWNKKLVEDFLRRQQQPQQNRQQGEQSDQQQNGNQPQQSGDDQSGNNQGKRQQGEQQGGQQSSATDNAQHTAQPGQNTQQQQASPSPSDDTQNDAQTEPDANASGQQPQAGAEKTDTQQQAAVNEHEQAEALPDDSSSDSEQGAQSRVTQRWLQRIPDDPGGLMRRKFLYQYNKRGARKQSSEPW